MQPLLWESSVLKCPWHKPSRCRPRERGDPVDTKPPVYISTSHKIFALEYWVPACAGTTAESHCFTSSAAGPGRVPQRFRARATSEICGDAISNKEDL